MSRPVLIRPSDRATAGGGVPPVPAILIPPRLRKNIPEPESDPCGSTTHILCLLTLRMAGSERHPTAPTMRFTACRPLASVILSPAKYSWGRRCNPQHTEATSPPRSTPKTGSFFPSRQEAFGLAALEAAMMARPIIATRVEELLAKATRS